MGTIALFLTTAGGFLVSLWLRDIFPSTQHLVVRYLSCIAVLVLIFLVYLIDIDYALMVLPVASGGVLSDLLALAIIQSSPSAAIPQRAADKGPKTAKPKQLVDEDTQSMHDYNEWVIKGAKPNKNDSYAARALPNKRLEDAFHVNNCFTGDSKRCFTFRGDVEKLLKPKNEAQHWLDWPELIEVAKTVARSALSVPGDEVNLFDAIHLTVMKTMLKVLFGKSFEGSSKDHLILKLARGVNDQWIESKKKPVSGETPEWEFERQATLKAVAEEIFEEWDAENLKNPFNKILPGYETMWRVVLRSVLEIASTRHPAATKEAWKERLASFIKNPTRDQLQNQKNDAGLTAEYVSFEVLRLYPPTRHVARMHTDKIGPGERVLIAHIEEMHHTAPVWGGDPLIFRPERWATLNGMDQTGYMPFGCSPFNCPARQHRIDKAEIPFGVTMIAVLTACFLEAMAGKWRLDGDFPHASQPLCNARKSYANVSLRRIEPHAAHVTSNVVDESQAVVDTTDAHKTETNNTKAYNTIADNTIADNTIADDDNNADNRVADNTGTDNTGTDNTGTDNTGTDNTGTDNTSVEDTNADDTESNNTNANKADDDKAEGEAKAELSETHGSDGEGEKQTAGVQQQVQ